MAHPKSETANRAAEDIGTVAAEARSRAGEEVRTRAEGAKSSLADEMASVASALKAAAREYDSGSTGSKTFADIAEGLERASDTVRHKSLGAMVSDLNSYARAHPAVFLGGAALLGFAASRFAKTSAEGPSRPAAATASAPSTDTTEFRP